MISLGLVPVFFTLKWMIRKQGHETSSQSNKIKYEQQLKTTKYEKFFNIDTNIMTQETINTKQDLR